MEIIFENKKQIKKSEIPVQIILVFLFLILYYFVSKIRFINREMNPNITLIFGIVLGLIFIYQVISAKTIKRIEKNTETGKLTFVFSRQLRNDEIKELNISELSIRSKKIPTRSNTEKILIISDKVNEIKLSTNQKGITETELNKILNEIESTTHNNG
jgi:hypothetical protein|tara:strand:- start:59 stop:532 length:474 start_codon:yes stop_codon:yes gene_type:complete